MPISAPRFQSFTLLSVKHGLVTPRQVELLDRYEPELRPGLPPLDRNIELPWGPLGVRHREMRDRYYISNWSKEKVYASAIIYLIEFGYDPEWEEEAYLTLHPDWRKDADVVRKHKDYFHVSDEQIDRTELLLTARELELKERRRKEIELYLARNPNGGIGMVAGACSLPYTPPAIPLLSSTLKFPSSRLRLDPFRCPPRWTVHNTPRQNQVGAVGKNSTPPFPSANKVRRPPI